MATNTSPQSPDSIPNRLGRLEDGFARVEDRLARLEDRFAGVEDRVARLEETVANIKTTMSTVAHIEGVKTLMAQMEARQTKWLLGIMTAAAVSLVVAFVRTSAG